MAKNINDYKFKTKDKLLWWISNLLSLIASMVLALSVVVSLPFRKSGSKAMKFAVKIVAICVVMALLMGGYLYYSNSQTKNFGEESQYLIIKRGDTMYDIAYKLQEMGAISSEFNFIIFARLLGHTPRLKAGRYSIEPGYSLHNIFDILTRGAAVPFNVTILEGLTLDQIGDELAKNLMITKEDYLTVCSDRTMLDSLNIPSDNLEGYIFPDTYNFFYDESATSVVNKMLNQFYTNLPDSFEQKAKARGLDLHEAVTMASLIESEAMLDSERPIISAVYHSRLKIRMRLQCDPTVIYALGGINRRLYYKDLEIDSPYNTYKYYGLPPGPICSPGKASLEAAVNPASVDYLYFVAKGDGSHVFSRTNDEHVNAKNRIKRSQLFGRN
jgi:UPF0755 protein